jgi:hypothetical protein
MSNIRYEGGAGSVAQQSDADLIDNYDLLRLPADNDDLVLENTAYSWLYGLDHSAIDLKSLALKQSFTGLFGLADSPVKFRAGARVEIGEHYGPDAPAGSARINLELVATSAQGQATQVIVHNTAAAGQESNMMPCRLVIDDADGVVEVRKGKVGLAERAGETTALSRLRLSYVSSRDSDAEVHVGAGAVINQIDQQGGLLKLEAGVAGASAKIEQAAGTLIMDTDQDSAEIYAAGGRAYLDRFGTITTLYMDGGDVDLTRTQQTRAITNVVWRVAGGSLKWDPTYTTIGGWTYSVATKLAASKS